MAPSIPLLRVGPLARVLVPAFVVVVLAAAGSASADAAAVRLGTAAGFDVLGGSAVTNTGPTVLGADLGVSPSSAVTGFRPASSAATSTPTTPSRCRPRPTSSPPTTTPRAAARPRPSAATSPAAR